MDTNSHLFKLLNNRFSYKVKYKQSHSSVIYVTHVYIVHNKEDSNSFGLESFEFNKYLHITYKSFLGLQDKGYNKRIDCPTDIFYWFTEFSLIKRTL